MLARTFEILKRMWSLAWGTFVRVVDAWALSTIRFIRLAGDLEQWAREAALSFMLFFCRGVDKSTDLLLLM